MQRFSLQAMARELLAGLVRLAAGENSGEGRHSVVLLTVAKVL